MTLVQLSLCAGSIYSTFLLWGLMQERLTKTPYTAQPTLLHPVPAPEYFRSPLFLNTIQALLSSIVACIYLLLRSRGSQKRIMQVLGFEALTSDGAAKLALAAGPVANRTRSASDVASTQAHWISPLLFRYLAIAALQSTASQLGFLSLRYISYPTLTLAKSCKLVPVLLMNVILYRRKFARYKYVVVILVTAGIWLFMAFAPSSESKKGREASSVLGLLLCFLNLVLDGATNSTQDEVFSKFGRKAVSAGQMMLVMNALSTLMMGATLLVPLHAIGLASTASNELATALGFIQRHPNIVRDILAYALAGAIGQVAIFETLERFGSLTLVSITVTRKLFTMLLSVIVYKHQLAIMQWLGVAVVFAGIAIEAREKRREGLAKQVIQDQRKALAKDA